MSAAEKFIEILFEDESFIFQAVNSRGNNINNQVSIDLIYHHNKREANVELANEKYKINDLIFEKIRSLVNGEIKELADVAYNQEVKDSKEQGYSYIVVKYKTNYLRINYDYLNEIDKKYFEDFLLEVADVIKRELNKKTFPVSTNLEDVKQLESKNTVNDCWEEMANIEIDNFVKQVSKVPEKPKSVYDNWEELTYMELDNYK